MNNTIKKQAEKYGYTKVLCTDVEFHKLMDAWEDGKLPQAIEGPDERGCSVLYFANDEKDTLYQDIEQILGRKANHLKS